MFIFNCVKTIIFNIIRLRRTVKARVIGTTPKFAKGIYAPTTLYDLMKERET